MKYKKVSYNYLTKQIKNNNKMYVDFINKYISEYLEKFLRIKTIGEFIEYNEKYQKKFSENTENTKDTSLSFHLLIDEKLNKIVAIEKTLKITKKFFDIKYFTELKKYCKIDNEYIYYAVNLFVDPEYRGQHLCQKILKKIKKKGQEKNIKYIISEIHNNNIPSIKCHEKNGFVKTDIFSYRDTPFYVSEL